MQEVAQTVAAVDCASDTTRVFTLGNHILERRVEYLLGSLILYTTGILDRILSQASGMC